MPGRRNSGVASQPPPGDTLASPFEIDTYPRWPPFDQASLPGKALRPALASTGIGKSWQRRSGLTHGAWLLAQASENFRSGGRAYFNSYSDTAMAVLHRSCLTRLARHCATGQAVRPRLILCLWLELSQNVTFKKVTW